MSNGFDAYHKWLSIPPHDQPPNHYRLLGLGLFESDPDVVAAAADRQMAHVQTYKTGPHSELSQKLLNEISAAKLCLLRPHKKTAYDDQLRQKLGVLAAGVPTMDAPPMGTPPAGIPSIGAARLTNPAAYANVGSVDAGMPRGMSYPGFSNSPVAPPPPALPPPVTDAPSSSRIGTMAILVAAGVVAVALLIGIVMVLGRRNDHASSSTSVEKSDANPGPDAPTPANVPAPAAQPVLVVKNPPSTNTNPATTITSGPGPASPFQKGFQSGPTPGTTSTSDAQSKIDHSKKPPGKTGSEVATNVPNVNVPPDKNRPDKTNPPPGNPPKPIPDKPAPVKPVLDPSLAGKAAVPDKALIATVEQRSGISAEVSAADLLDKAHQATEAVEIYVFLRRALDAAVKQGDAAMAISTVDELARRFAVNSLEVRTQTLNDLQTHVQSSESLIALAEAATALIDDATAAAQPDLAQHLAEMSLTTARKSGNLETIRKVTLRIVHMRAAPLPFGS